MRRVAVGLVLAASLLACGGERPSLPGIWRAVLSSPGGELPFTLEIRPPGSAVPAVGWNDEERVPFTSAGWDGDTVVLRIDGYDSEIRAHLQGDRMDGEWTRPDIEGITRLPFAATRGDRRRFLPPTEAERQGADPAARSSVAGPWAVMFHDDTGDQPARAELRQQEGRVTGTFLTPAGDYRFLEGDFQDGLLRLSAFDGGHAFLLHGRVRQDGTIAGDFWSRDVYHATWTARPIEGNDDDGLPDQYDLVGLRRDDGRFSFRFPDLDGRPVSLEDERFRGRVVLVNLFGSWCPNCNDEAPLLAEWYRRYHDRGLEIVGLAFEVTGDPERDAAFVRKYAERNDIPYPLLLAGVSDKAKASETLPDLTSIVAFPTTIFIGRDGRVRRIHSGFRGPGTGKYYEQLKAEFEARIEKLLAETPPS